MVMMPHTNNQSFDYDLFFKTIRRLIDQSKDISEKSETLLNNMWKDVTAALESTHPDAKLNAVKLWIGGMISVLITDDIIYRSHMKQKDLFYPHHIELREYGMKYLDLNDETKQSISYDYFIGNEVLKRPELFYGELFRIKSFTFGVGLYRCELFPMLYNKVDYINEMLSDARLLNDKDLQSTLACSSSLFSPAAQSIDINNHTENSSKLLPRQK